MALYDDLRLGGFLDPKYGMVSIYNHDGAQGPNCDNYWLFTAIAMTLAKFKSWPGAARFYLDSRIEQGLIRRFPERDSDVSQQELVGAACLDTAFAIQIEHYGVTHWWCYNAQNPGQFKINYFFGRFIDFVPIIREEAVSFFDLLWLGKILWSIGLVTTTFSDYGDTSEKVYKWLQVEKMRGRHWITSLAIGLWVRLMQRKYPGGPKELFKEYFPAGHPFLTYAPEKF